MVGRVVTELEAVEPIALEQEKPVLERRRGPAHPGQQLGGSRCQRQAAKAGDRDGGPRQPVVVDRPRRPRRVSRRSSDPSLGRHVRRFDGRAGGRSAEELLEPAGEARRHRRRLHGRVEMASHVAQVVGLRLGRGDPPREVAERGEIALLDDRRGRDLEVDVAEQRRVVLELVGVLERRERGGEPDDVGVLEPRNQCAQDDRPVIEQVMTLVEDDGAHTRGRDAVDEGASVRVEIPVGRRTIGGQQVATDPLDSLPELVSVGVGVGLGHAPDALTGGIRIRRGDHLPCGFARPRPRSPCREARPSRHRASR